MSDGSVDAQLPTDLVSKKLLGEIVVWVKEKCTMEDIITRLRQRTVPRGYLMHTWKEGKCIGLSTCIIMYYVHNNRSGGELCRQSAIGTCTTGIHQPG